MRLAVGTHQLVLGFCVVSTILASSRAAQATALIAVTTTADEDGTGPACSLREAIEAANTDRAYGGCIAGSGDDYVYFETRGRTITLSRSAALSVRGVLTIQGDGTTLEGGSSQGIVAESESDLSIDGLHLTGFTSSTPIRVKGSLTLESSDIHHNLGSGGAQTMGIEVSTTGSLLATGIALRGNSGVKGGGIYNLGGFVSLVNSSVVANTAALSGGGIMTTTGGYTEIINCTVSGNVAQTGAGGGIYDGAGSTTELYGSTVYGNSAKDGGGIWEDSSSPFAYVSVRNTIVSNNTAERAPGCRGLVYSYRGNLIGSNACTLTPIGAPTPHALDQLGVSDVRLAPLARVGSGIQWAHVPLRDSPALDRISGSPNHCYRRYDQSSAARPRGPACDVGAIEK